MKKNILRSICFLLMATCTAAGQTELQTTAKKKSEVTKYTVMERFEPDMMLSAEERLELKKERVAEIKRHRQILDTLDISERRRKKLMSDISKDPFSPRLSRTMAKIEFEDDKK